MARPVHLTFIHGLANKPAPAELRRLWLDALRKDTDDSRGFDPEAEGVTVSFVYWADLFYSEPIPAEDYESRNDELAAQVAAPVTVAGEPEPGVPTDPWTLALAAKLEIAMTVDPPVTPATDGYERIPLPGFLKQKLMRHFLREAHAYLFDVNGVRGTLRQRVLDDLAAAPAGSRRILVGHSQGTIIAYDVLAAVAECPDVDGLLTLGSPLGIDEVQDRLESCPPTPPARFERGSGFPSRLRGEWVNVYDPFDAVARADPKLANDYRRAGERVVSDVEEENWGKWRHSATKYLQRPKLRAVLRRLSERELQREA